MDTETERVNDLAEPSLGATGEGYVGWLRHTRHVPDSVLDFFDAPSLREAFPGSWEAYLDELAKRRVYERE